MFKIYNKDALTRNERFQNACIAAIVVTLALTIAYGFISSVLAIELQLLYMFFGYVIGMTIQKVGHGVQVRFSILGAVCAFICFFIGDIISIFGFSILFAPSMYGYVLRTILSIWLGGLDVGSLLSLAFRVIGICIAYAYSRIV